MNSITEKKVLSAINDAILEEQKQINIEIIELRKIVGYTVPKLERDIKKIKQDNEVLNKFLSNYRDLITRLEKPYSSIERISHQEYHDDGGGGGGGYFEEGYKVISELRDDEIFILESGSL